MAKRKKEIKLTVIVTESADGGYVGYVKELPGCATQGDTIEELQENMQDLIPDFIEALFLESQKKQAPQVIGKVVKRQVYLVRPVEIVHV